MEETKRKLASIQKILKLEPIEGADKIEVATIQGWHVVVKKGEFHEGDLCIYFEVDSLLPIREEYAFLQSGGIKRMIHNQKEVEGYRIKTVRLRGQISQGIAFPIKTLLDPDVTDYFEGDDVTPLLGVIKYEIPLPAQLAGKARGNFPGFLPKTDEPRIQNFPRILEQHADKKFFITEKLDGSSVTFVIKNGEFHVCSRSLDLLDDGKNTIWRVAKEMKIEEQMRKLPSEAYAIQGEIVGDKIQNNTLKISGHKIYFFNAYNYETGEYLDFQEFKDIFGFLGFETVPILHTGIELPKTVDEAVAMATRKSVINPDSWAEGIVYRPLKELKDTRMGRVSFKVINPEFLLKYE